MAVVVSTE